MCLLILNPTWISIIIAALSLVVSVWAIISAKRSNKRVEQYNNDSIRLKYRPVIEMENGYKVDPVECTITFNLVSNNNESVISKIVLLTNDYACCQPRKFPIHLAQGDIVLLNFESYRSEAFQSSMLSVDVIYEDIIGNVYKTHIEGNPSGLVTIPAVYPPSNPK